MTKKNKDVQLAAVPATREGSYVMPSDVMSIWKDAFANSSLTSVVLNSNIKAIKEGTFKNCKNLKSLVFESIECPNVDENAFEGATNVKFFIPRGTTEVYSGIFSSVTEYFETTDKMRYYIKSSEAHLLGYSRDLEEYLAKNDGIVRVASDVAIESNGSQYTVIEIDDCALAYALGMKQAIIYPKLTRIGSFNFIGCHVLESISVTAQAGKYSSTDGILYANRNFNDKDVQLIAVPAMLEGTFTMPSDVNSVWKGAFDCSRLTSVVFNSKITTIKDRMFKNAKNLESVDFQTATPPTFGKEVFIGCNGTITIYVPKGCKSSYETATSHLNNVIVVEKDTNSSSVEMVGADIAKDLKGYVTIENGKIIIVVDGEKWELSGRKL